MKIFICLVLFVLYGCVMVSGLPSRNTELREYEVKKGGDDKVVLIDITDVITLRSSKSFLEDKPSVVHRVKSQLELAKSDPDVKAVILRIDSPGGTAVASQTLYRQIKQFRESTGKKVIAYTFDRALSGGYYAAVAADYIMSHRDSMLGSVGAIFFLPNVQGLLSKVGVDVNIYKSGKYKDIGSSVRKSTAEEKAILQRMVKQGADNFLKTVKERRKINNEKHWADISTARIFSGVDALNAGLVDELGSLEDAFAKLEQMLGISNPKAIVYRRAEVGNDTMYNLVLNKSLFPLGAFSPDNFKEYLKPGLYFLDPSMMPVYQ